MNVDAADCNCIAGVTIIMIIIILTVTDGPRITKQLAAGGEAPKTRQQTASEQQVTLQWQVA